MGSRLFTTEEMISVARRLSVVTSSVFIKCYFSVTSKEMQIKPQARRKGQSAGRKGQGAERLAPGALRFALCASRSPAWRFALRALRFDHFRQCFLEIPFRFKAKQGFDFLGTEPGGTY